MSCVKNQEIIINRVWCHEKIFALALPQNLKGNVSYINLNRKKGVDDVGRLMIYASSREFIRLLIGTLFPQCWLFLGRRLTSEKNI